MSDISTEGSAAKPYRENPPTHFVEVHWSGGIAVKWNFSQFMYRDGALAVGNSPTGTLSVWLKFHPDLATYGRGVASLFYSSWMDFSVSTRDDWSTVVHGGAPWGMTEVERAYHKFKFFPSSAEAFFTPGAPNTYAYLVDTGAAFPATSKWYHLFVQWDTAAGTLAIKVNGRTVSSVVYPGSWVDPRDLGPPFNVDWGWPTSNDGTTPNSSQFLSNANLADALPVGFSIAEYWLDNTAPLGLTVDKFVDLKTGRPKSLGASGELPKGAKPAFYFSRTGAPQSFVANRGYGGAFQFARGHYASDLSFTVEDIADPASDPPLDEPERPQFTPIVPAAAAA